MGNRFNRFNQFTPVIVGFVPHGDKAAPDVGERFCVIGPDLLIERGDEYLDDCGSFVPFPLEAVGRRVVTGLLARRPVRK